LSTGEPAPRGGAWTRRKLLAFGLGGAAAVVGAGVTGLELISHGALPGQQLLDQLDGACSVSSTPFVFAAPLGPALSREFFSAPRNRMVGYTLAWPPGHAPGSKLPLVVMLHGYGGDHANALGGVSPQQAVALLVGGRALRPMAMVTVDGGNGYWNPHPGDDPMSMVIHELIPMCQQMGLGRPPQRIGTMGISMGGYGAVLLAERFPHLVDAVAAISPAVWTSYAQADAANPTAYASAADFAAKDVVTHAGALAGIPVRVAPGYEDPFHPGVEALAGALPAGAVVDFSQGCHTGPFENSQEPLSLSFLSAHLG
jgi:predicted esterase